MQARDETDYDYLFKIVLVGNSSTGKTSLVRRFTDHTFEGDTQKATVGVQFQVVTIPLQSGCKAKLQIWDTAGQERFRAISSAYYRGAHGVVLVFDLTSEQSFEDLPSWLEEVRNHHPEIRDSVRRQDYEDELEYEIAYEEQRLNAPLLHLLGNKIDLGRERAVTHERAAAYAEQHDMAYRETSAKVGSGVFDAFLELATSLELQQQAALRLDTANEKRILSNSKTVKLERDDDDGEGGERQKQEKKCNC